jgi:hypothetical protein
MPLKFNTANGAIIVSAEDGSGDAAVTFPRSNPVGETHTGDVSITGDLTTTGAVDITGDLTTTGAVDITGDAEIDGTFYAKVYEEAEKVLNLSTEIDCSISNFFRGSFNGNTTYTFTNPPTEALRAYSFTLQLKNAGSGSATITWPTSVKWAGGTAPDAPAAGEIDYFVFTTHNNGTDWYGFQAGDAMA